MGPYPAGCKGTAGTSGCSGVQRREGRQGGLTSALSQLDGSVSCVRRARAGAAPLMVRSAARRPQWPVSQEAVRAVGREHYGCELGSGDGFEADTLKSRPPARSHRGPVRKRRLISYACPSASVYGWTCGPPCETQAYRWIATQREAAPHCHPAEHQRWKGCI